MPTDPPRELPIVIIKPLQTMWSLNIAAESPLVTPLKERSTLNPGTESKRNQLRCNSLCYNSQDNVGSNLGALW